MRIPALILTATLGLTVLGCDEGGSGSQGPGVNTNNSGASTGGAAVNSNQNTAQQGTTNNPHGGGSGSTAQSHGTINADGGSTTPTK